MKGKVNENKKIKNIVLLSFDSLRSDYVEHLKYEEAPHIFLMREKGAFFKNAIVQAPFTIPSFASMMTGLYPAKTGVRDMHHKLFDDIPGIFSILKNESFSTSSIEETPLIKKLNFKGVDEYRLFSKAAISQAFSAKDKKPFFTFIHYWDTHTPYETILPITRPIDLLLNALRPLDKYKNKRIFRKILWYLWLQRVMRIRALTKNENKNILPAVKKGYKGSLIRADKFVGSLLGIAKNSGEYNNTLFILTGDHGDSFNEHNEIHKGFDNRYEHGQFLYDNVVKVPLIFYSPNNIVIPRKIKEQIQLIDILPTILEALNIRYSGELDGFSLWKALIGNAKIQEREYAFTEVIRESMKLELRSVRTRLCKLICDYNSGRNEYYDLKNDPDEKNNLWPTDEFGKLSALSSQLKNHAKIRDLSDQSRLLHDQDQIEKTLKSLGYM